MSRPIYEIAKEIKDDWGLKINYAAKPYLEAMFSLNKITDNYYADSGRSVVVYFLGNAQTWRGQVARKIKQELKDILNGQEKLEL